MVHPRHQHALGGLSAALLLQSLDLLIFFLNLIRLDAHLFLQPFDLLVLLRQASPQLLIFRILVLMPAAEGRDHSDGVLVVDDLGSVVPETARGLRVDSSFRDY